MRQAVLLSALVGSFFIAHGSATANVRGQRAVSAKAAKPAPAKRLRAKKVFRSGRSMLLLGKPKKVRLAEFKLPTGVSGRFLAKDSRGRALKIFLPKGERAAKFTSKKLKELFSYYEGAETIGGPSIAGYVDQGAFSGIAFYDAAFERTIPLSRAQPTRESERVALVNQAVEMIQHGISVTDIFIVPTKKDWTIRFQEMKDFSPEALPISKEQAIAKLPRHWQMLR